MGFDSFYVVQYLKSYLTLVTALVVFSSKRSLGL
jgi:hypothetical protein